MSNHNFLLFPGFLSKAVTLSYDDGVRQDKKLIDIMLKNGLKGTFNLNSGLFETKQSSEFSGRMTKEEAVALYNKSQMEVGVHGYKHLSLTHVDIAVANNEIVIDRNELESLFGRIIKGMAYSFGQYNDDIIDLLKKCGISYSRTTVSTEDFCLPSDWLSLPATCHHNNPKLMDLAKSFIDKEYNKYSAGSKPMLFYLWGHSYEFDRDNNWDVIENFAEYIGNREDVWYATNGEIYQYVKDFDSLQFSIDGSMVYNPSAQTIYYNHYGKYFEIKPKTTVVLGHRGFI